MDEPRKMTPTERYHDIITNLILASRARQSSSKRVVQNGKIVSAEFYTAHDDPAEADRINRELVAAHIAENPAVEAHPASDFEHTRNAKGETQLKSSVKSNGELHPMDVLRLAQDAFEADRAHFPLSDGTVSHDAPKPAAKR